jgi:hypothetical protein
MGSVAMPRNLYLLITICISLIFQFLFISCAQKVPKEALQLSPESLKNRQMQTRRFDTDEKTMLSAGAAVLQDLGFTIDESETDLGLIACSKLRDATSAGQIAGAVIVALLTGVLCVLPSKELSQTHRIKQQDANALSSPKFIRNFLISYHNRCFWRRMKYENKTYSCFHFALYFYNVAFLCTLNKTGVGDQRISSGAESDTDEGV